jgi:hypothetical protein
MARCLGRPERAKMSADVKGSGTPAGKSPSRSAGVSTRMVSTTSSNRRSSRHHSDGYVVDVARAGELVEIQTRSFASAARKLRRLVANHRIVLVHPIKWREPSR